jgi:adenine/guanine/hypoxanthine permease
MAQTKPSTIKWWVKGDLNGFFGLFSNVLTNFLAAIGLLLLIGMPTAMVFGIVVPGTAIAVSTGGIVLAYLAMQLAKKTNNPEVTAMPYGLSVPHYFAVAFGVILVVRLGGASWDDALAAGVVWNLIQGIIMTIGAFIGPFINKYLPRTALLGALAGLAITYISMNPAGEMFTTPYIGLTSFAIVLGGWFALKKLPFKIPAGAFAIIVGTILAWITGYMNPTAVGEAFTTVGLNLPIPQLGFLVTGFAYIAPFLPAAIPLAIYDFLESLDNLESTAAEGEHYPVTKSMLVPALATVVGSLLGSPFPTIIYIGHPGWKSTGARIGYSWVTGVAILVIAFTGLLNLVLSIVPLVALLPILVYIGMVITAQAFAVSEKRHFPAIALSFIPLIAGFVTLKVMSALGAVGAEIDYVLLANNGIPLLGWQRLSGGDILVGMLIGAIGIYIIDKKFLRAAVYAFITAGLAFFGFVHATSIGFPTSFDAINPVSIGYIMFGLVMLFFHYYKDTPEKNEKKEVATSK